MTKWLSVLLQTKWLWVRIPLLLFPCMKLKAVSEQENENSSVKWIRLGHILKTENMHILMPIFLLLFFLLKS